MSLSFVYKIKPTVVLSMRPTGCNCDVEAFLTKSYAFASFSSSEAPNPFGLFNNTYTFFSGFNNTPSKTTLSVGFTLYPISVTTSPFTVTFPDRIYKSASLREQTPEFAMYLFKRMASSLATNGLLATGFSAFGKGLENFPNFDPVVFLS